MRRDWETSCEMGMARRSVNWIFSVCVGVPVPVVGWISTESLQGSLHFCCSWMESVFSSAILLSLDVIKFWSSLEQGKQIWAEFWAIMSKKKAKNKEAQTFY